MGHCEVVSDDPRTPGPDPVTDTPEPESPGAPGDSRQRLGSPDRVLALSDGVFAIVITILVLEIAVPPNLSEGSLFQALEELRPTLLAWVISFLITGMYWVGHRDLFSRVRAVNRDLVWLNLLFLLTACLIPFAASVLGEYPDKPVAMGIYGIVVIAVSLMRLVMYWYLMRRPALVVDPQPAGRSWLGLAVAGAPIPVYVTAIAVAGASTTASVLLFLSVPGLYFLLVTVLRERPGTRAEAGDFS